MLVAQLRAAAARRSIAAATAAARATAPTGRFNLHHQRRFSRTAVVTMAALREEIAAAISVGVPLFNQGRPQDCYAVYRGAAQRLAASATTGAAEAQLLRWVLTCGCAFRCCRPPLAIQACESSCCQQPQTHHPESAGVPFRKLPIKTPPPQPGSCAEHLTRSSRAASRRRWRRRSPCLRAPSTFLCWTARRACRRPCRGGRCALLWFGCASSCNPCIRELVDSLGMLACAGWRGPRAFTYDPVHASPAPCMQAKPHARKPRRMHANPAPCRCSMMW